MRRRWQDGTMRFKHLHVFHDRFEQLRVYFRRAGFPRVALPTPVGSVEFIAAYHAAMGGKPLPPSGTAARTVAGSLSWLIAEWVGSDEFSRNKKESTQAARRQALHRFFKDCGAMTLIELDRDYIKESVEESPTTEQAKEWMKAVRPMMQYAVRKKYIDADPTEGVKIARRGAPSKGHYTWSEEDVAKYQARHQQGTMARLAFDLLLWLGQRRGDTIKLGRANLFTDKATGEVTVRLTQDKTDREIAVPLLAPLANSIRSMTAEGLTTFLVTTTGKRFSERMFNDYFSDWVAEAGLPAKCTPHGLRKTFTCRMVAKGKTAMQIAAWTGHKTLAEVQRYCDEYNREQAARQGAQGMEAFAA